MLDYVVVKNVLKKIEKIFKARMMRVYNKYNLADDPEHQKKMLAARKISGKYEWTNGGEPTTYVGSYEKDFLMNCDTVFNFESTDIIAHPLISIAICIMVRFTSISQTFIFQI